MTLYIVRHGETDWNKSRLMQGRTDTPLNEEGIRQATDLSKKINIDDIDICISSPLKRASETAKILVNNKLDIIYDKDLVERSFGDYEGKVAVYEDILRQWDYKLNDNTYNIETIKECLKRAKDVLDRIKKDYPNKNILIVSHGSFMKCLHFNLVGYDENTDFLSFKVNNADIFKYELNP